MKIIIKFSIALVFLTIFAPLAYNFIGITIYTFDVFLLPLFIFVILDVILNKRFYFKVSYAEKILIIFSVFVVLSNLFSINKAVSFNELFIWFRVSILYLILRYSLHNNLINEATFIKFISFTFITLVLIGYIQMITHTSFGLVANYFGDNLNQEEAFFSSSRISGTTKNSNIYGAWLVFLSTPLLVKYSLQGNNKLTSALLIVLTPLLLSTLSKGSLLYYAITIIVTFWLIAVSNRKALTRLSNTLLLILVSTIPLLLVFFVSDLGSSLLSSAYERFSITLTDDISGTSTRVNSMISFITLLQDEFVSYLFIGQGMNVYYETLESLEISHNVFQDYVDATSERSGIHNILMNFTASFGIIPTILFVYFYYLEVKKSKYLLTQSRDYISYSLYIMLIGLTFFSQVNTITWSINMMPLIALIFAIINYRYSLNRLTQ